MSTFTELITDRKEKSEWRGTIFNITINTQKSFKSKSLQTLEMMPELKEKYIAFLKSFFAEDNLTKFLVDLGRDGNRVEDAPPVTEDHIQKITAHTQIEANMDGNGYLHSHTIISVVHNTRLRVNVGMIRRIASTVLKKYLIKQNGEPGWVYVSATGRNSAFNSENYVRAGDVI